MIWNFFNFSQSHTKGQGSVGSKTGKNESDRGRRGGRYEDEEEGRRFDGSGMNQDLLDMLERDIVINGFRKPSD